ncbi:uncharacterized protein BCR38DRAFT_132039 [Pseudomassariella vexata]|uniref:Uncharacterized protein n=1 Tax=Pseudomassariella vexata TaxID=1141098 RepID=A0A1Y2EAU7_9PEZI|nr:uncharacterized protein BCR38DRAFT_132039 [Pseudomassariella vexata]ORY68424.1 hypothetical protein BCR38DRAFT_132039 [Pseudomassariella vexata]
MTLILPFAGSIIQLLIAWVRRNAFRSCASRLFCSMPTPSPSSPMSTAHHPPSAQSSRPHMTLFARSSRPQFVTFISNCLEGLARIDSRNISIFRRQGCRHRASGATTVSGQVFLAFFEARAGRDGIAADWSVDAQTWGDAVCCPGKQLSPDFQHSSQVVASAAHLHRRVAMTPHLNAFLDNDNEPGRRSLR